jgi:hypothetical protein
VEDIVDSELNQRQLQMTVLAGFSVLALALASIGITASSPLPSLRGRRRWASEWQSEVLRAWDDAHREEERCFEVLSSAGRAVRAKY